MNEGNNKMEIKEIMSHVDHTLLLQGATWDEIKVICDDALFYGTASVCIAPAFVKAAADYLAGRCPVCTVIGFPNGYNTTAVKCAETKDAIENGADEIDMVINIGDLKAKKYAEITEEIRSIKAVCKDKILKVSIYLTCKNLADCSVCNITVLCRQYGNFVHNHIVFCDELLFYGIGYIIIQIRIYNNIIIINRVLRIC